MSYKKAVAKRNIELILMWPFVLIGKIWGKLFPLKTEHNIFLFFSSADIGGAIKVNADIVECIKDKNPIIFFSKKPKNNEFIHLFEASGARIIDLHRYIDNKWYHFINFIFRGIISSWINRVETPVVFGGECLFFYKMIPHVKKQSKKIELCHLNTWFNYSIGFIDYIDTRVFSTPKIKRDVELQYEKESLPRRYYDKLVFIDNKVILPSFLEIDNDILQVLYVGRGAPQKRVHLIAEVARLFHTEKKLVHFSFVGDVEDIIPKSIQSYCTLYGNIKDENLLNEIYNKSDILLLTSAYEGLPVVVMDMMARGKVVISTAVDGIPDYITHKENGLLITEIKEELIVKQAQELINLILGDQGLKKELGRKSYSFAKAHFSGELFCNSYRELLIN